MHRTLLFNLFACCSVSEALSHEKFKHWYPFYGPVLDLILKGECLPYLCKADANCSAELAAYQATTSAIEAVDKCYPVFDCLSSGVLPNELSNFQSAQVLLALTPFLLTSLGPSVGEIALLSTRRKLLALLLALGNPAISVSRLLSYSDPIDSLENGPTAFPKSSLELSSRTAICVSILQYALASGAVINAIQLSWQLGYRTLVAWKCTSSFLPFLWTILPVAVHVVGVTGWHVSESMTRLRHQGHTDQSSSRTRRLGHSIGSLLKDEFQIGFRLGSLDLLKRRRGSEMQEKHENALAIFLNELAGFGAFLHVLFGTLVFSSLMFIGVLDALGVIGRYIASGLVCRFVLSWELAGMRLAEGRVRQEERSNVIPLMSTDATSTK